MTRDVLRERQNYQAHATEEIAAGWGREQRLLGPGLEVPYVYTKGTVAKTKLVNGQLVSVDEPATLSACAYFLPEELRVDAVADPEIRHRGIYDTVVYTTRVKVSGVVQIDFAAAGIEANRVEWDKARMMVGVSDLHGVRSVGPLHAAGLKEVPFEAAYLLQQLLKNLLALVRQPPLRLQRLLEEVADRTVLRVLEVGLAILRALQRMIEDGDDVVCVVWRGEIVPLHGDPGEVFLPEEFLLGLRLHGRELRDPAGRVVQVDVALLTDEMREDDGEIAAA